MDTATVTVANSHSLVQFAAGFSTSPTPATGW